VGVIGRDPAPLWRLILGDVWPALVLVTVAAVCSLVW
jgi:hypothetical protein